MQIFLKKWRHPFWKNIIDETKSWTENKDQGLYSINKISLYRKAGGGCHEYFWNYFTDGRLHGANESVWMTSINPINSCLTPYPSLACPWHTGRCSWGTGCGGGRESIPHRHPEWWTAQSPDELFPFGKKKQITEYMSALIINLRFLQMSRFPLWKEV